MYTITKRGKNKSRDSGNRDPIQEREKRNSHNKSKARSHSNNSSVAILESTFPDINRIITEYKVSERMPRVGKQLMDYLLAQLSTW